MISANITNAQRKAIYRRDGWRCALCDSTKYIQIHHIIQRSRGGGNHPHNLITLCADCHALAHGMDLRGLGEGDAPATPAQSYYNKALDDLDDIERDRPIDQAIVEYMSDLYASEGVLWCPWLKKGQCGQSLIT